MPVPDARVADREAVGTSAVQITEQARTRYDPHQKTRRYLLTDLCTSGKKLNQKLTA